MSEERQIGWFSPLGAKNQAAIEQATTMMRPIMIDKPFAIVV